MSGLASLGCACIAIMGGSGQGAAVSAGSMGTPPTKVLRSVLQTLIPNAAQVVATPTLDAASVITAFTGALPAPLQSLQLQQQPSSDPQAFRAALRGLAATAAASAASTNDSGLLTQLHSFVVSQLSSSLEQLTQSPESAGAMTSAGHTSVACMHALEVTLPAMEQLTPGVTRSGPASGGSTGSWKECIALVHRAAASEHLPGSARGAACQALGLLAGLPGHAQALSQTTSQDLFSGTLSQQQPGSEPGDAAASFKKGPSSALVEVVRLLSACAAGEAGVSAGTQTQAARAGEVRVGCSTSVPACTEACHLW
jgi:hypothetical protein